MQHPSAHQILLFLLQMGLLLALARSLGEVARRLGLPEFAGELLAGVLVGPSVLGELLPGLQRSLFPPHAAQGGPTAAVAALGLVLLLLINGCETDIELVARRVRLAVSTAAGGIVLPFVAGVGLALLLPRSLAGPHGGRAAFALFVATAMSISALPVTAKILLDLRLIRRELGQRALAAGMLNDTSGWILLALVAAVATSGGSPAAVAPALAGVLAAVGLAFRFGPRACGALLRWVEATTGQRIATYLAVPALVLAAAALTQAVGLEPFVGAFAAGAALGRVARARRVRNAMAAITLGVFAPLFFAIAGLRVDLPRLLAPQPLGALGAIVAVALCGKLLGAYLGARLGTLPHGLAVNLAVGQNARGTVPVVVAAVGLALGVLRPGIYTALVVMAVATTVTTAPLLRRTLGLLPADRDEARHPMRPLRTADGPFREIHRILVPTRGGANARAGAAIAAHLVRHGGVEVTALHVARMSAARIGPAGRGGAIRTGAATALAPPATRTAAASRRSAAGGAGPGAEPYLRALAAAGPGPAMVTPAGRPGAAAATPDAAALEATAAALQAAAAAPEAAAPEATAAALQAAAATPEAAVATAGGRGPGDPAAPPAAWHAQTDAAWHARTATGPPAATILQEAHRGYDLLVIGASEIGRTREVLLGSVVDSVLRLARCATLVVRAGRRSGPDPRRILLPTAGTGVDADAARLAVEIAAGCGAAITALHVVEARSPGPDAQRQIRLGYAAVEAVTDLAGASAVPAEGRVALARFAGTEILRFASAGAFDMIVMGDRLRRAGRRVLHGRTVTYVLNHPVCDLALFNPHPAGGPPASPAAVR